MKKILAVAASLMLVVVSANSQSEKKEPPPPPPPEVITKKIDLPSGHFFYKQHPEVRRYTWVTGNKIIIRLKKNKKEEYNMEDETEYNKFVSNYGGPVEIPPPPPPKVITKKIDLPSGHFFYKQHPEIRRYTWVTGNKIIIHLKKNKKEEYNMEDETEYNKFVSNYGGPVEIPPPPPPKQKTKA